jgi:hypothetical protein
MENIIFSAWRQKGKVKVVTTYLCYVGITQQQPHMLVAGWVGLGIGIYGKFEENMVKHIHTHTHTNGSGINLIK